MMPRKPENNRTNRTGFTKLQVVVLMFCTIFIQRAIQKPNLGFDKETMDFSMYLPESSSQQSFLNPLAIPAGGARNLPSVRVHDKVLESLRSNSQAKYGGQGDAKHLGGFTEIDMHGISPAAWKHAVTNWTVQSVLDVGCGRGISTSWFVTHGLRTECVEGSHDAITQSMVPDKSILTEHDFSRGPWWPEKTFDMVWSVEFLEHVSLHFQYNYISAFRKAAIICVTSSKWGGWHHVEVHKDDWWIRKYEAYGFRYDEQLTKEIRHQAQKERNSHTLFPPTNKDFGAQHVWTSMKVFINPVVAALPEHAHLFGEPGCFHDYGKPNRECGVPAKRNQKKSAEIETPLDPSFHPLNLTLEQDQAWYDIVGANIPPPK